MLTAKEVPDMEHMIKTAKWIDRLCLVLFAATAVSAALVIGGLVLPAAGAAVPVIFPGTAAGTGFALVSAVLSFGAFLAGIALVRQILRPMKDGRPFCGVVTRNLRRLGILTLICAVLDLGCQTFGAGLIARTMAAAGEGAEMVVSHRWSPLLLIGAALLFLMSYVFRYGEELQQLSDETL